MELILKFARKDDALGCYLKRYQYGHFKLLVDITYDPYHYESIEAESEFKEITVSSNGGRLPTIYIKNFFLADDKDIADFNQLFNEAQEIRNIILNDREELLKIEEK